MQPPSLRALVTILVVVAVSFGAAFIFAYSTSYATLRAAEAPSAASPESPKVDYLAPASNLLPHLVSVVETQGGVVLNEPNLIPVLDDPYAYNVRT
jgi:hypothetical protein